MNQYTAPTIIVPPIILPMVTGTRLFRRKFETVRSGYIAALLPAVFQKEDPAPERMSSPIGIKYMLATQCSKPAATKAVIGKMIAERALKAGVKEVAFDRGG